MMFFHVVKSTVKSILNCFQKKQPLYIFLIESAYRNSTSQERSTLSNVIQTHSKSSLMLSETNIELLVQILNLALNLLSPLFLSAAEFMLLNLNLNRDLFS